MNLTPFFQATGLVLGTLIGVPMLIKVWQAATTFSALQSDVSNVNRQLSEFVDRATKILEDHETRLRDHGERVLVLDSTWDGHERRRRT